MNRNLEDRVTRQLQHIESNGPEDQESIFEDLRQLDDSPTRVYAGTGLGLSICRRLTTMLGGRISLRSRSQKGSTFTLLVPAWRPGSTRWRRRTS